MFRLIEDGSHDGATNMARDEALLESVGSGAVEPTLRLYGWEPPTISLGYFQRYEDFEALPPPAGELEVVRRQTGGGAILHDQELTYSLTVPRNHDLVDRCHTCLYSLAHDALIATLKRFGLSTAMAGVTDQSTPTHGPFFCFARRHELDVVMGDGKLAGSAQRVTRKTILQHGSIMLDRRYDQQPIAAVGDAAKVNQSQFISSWVEELSQAIGQEFEPGHWEIEELMRADELYEKYAGDEWTRKR